MLWRTSPRSTQTTIPCSKCKNNLMARRSCHEAYLECEHCRKRYEVQEYIQQMDAKLESFLESINCDRV